MAGYSEADANFSEPIFVFEESECDWNGAGFRHSSGAGAIECDGGGCLQQENPRGVERECEAVGGRHGEDGDWDGGSGLGRSIGGGG